MKKIIVEWDDLMFFSDFRYDMSFWTAAAGGTADLDIQAAQDLFDFTSDFVLLEMIHRLGKFMKCSLISFQDNHKQNIFSCLHI